MRALAMGKIDMPNQPTQREYWSGKVGDAWAAYADRIDTMLRPVTAAVLPLAAFRHGERVLDIGCGAGATSVEIARRVGASGSVVGVDLSPQLLRVARERAEQAGLSVQFLEADAGEAELGERFDVAYSRFGVMFFANPPQAFAHLRASMRPEGRLLFVCWRDIAENPWATIPIEAIKPMLKAPLPTPDPDAPGPYSLADGAKVQRILHEAQWRNVELKRWEGELMIAGGGSAEAAADFLLTIGPCARAIADQDLDPAEAKRRMVARLSPLHNGEGVALRAGCWFVTAAA